MSLYVKQASIKSKARSEVIDDNRCVRWYIQREGLPVSFNLGVYDTAGNKVAAITQKLAFNSRFDITINGARFATLNKVTTMLKPKYELEGVTWTLEGDFYMRNFKAYSQYGGLVMSQQTQWYTSGDTYIIDFSKPSEELYCLCVALAIDCADANSYDFRH